MIIINASLLCFFIPKLRETLVQTGRFTQTNLDYSNFKINKSYFAHFYVFGLIWSLFLLCQRYALYTQLISIPNYTPLPGFSYFINPIHSLQELYASYSQTLKFYIDYSLSLPSHYISSLYIQPNQSVLAEFILLLVFMFQMMRRTYESYFITKFSNSQMLVNKTKIIFY